MSPRLVLTVMAGLCLVGNAAGQPASRSASASAAELSLEVQALLLLHKFDLTPLQMEALRKVAATVSPKNDTRSSGKGSVQLRNTLTDLREALRRDRRDDDAISDLEDKLADLKESDDLDDEVEITDAASRRASEVLRGLKPRQVANYLADFGDSLPDPLERLLEALDKVTELDDAAWKELREEIVEEVSWLMGGLDRKKAKLVGDKVGHWLGQVRGLKDKDFVKRRPELEAAARLFVAQLPPTAVLHNIAEHGVAELLSNPRVIAAIDARLEK